MPRYTICPYYIDDNKKTVSCEDVIRRFASYHSKNKWMNKHCDKDWQSCPYAESLGQMYERIGAGSDEAQEMLKHKAEALQRENKKMCTLLGRYDVRLDAKDAEIRQLRKKNKELEDAKYQEFRKRQAAEKKLKEIKNGKRKEQDQQGSGTGKAFPEAE